MTTDKLLSGELLCVGSAIKKQLASNFHNVLNCHVRSWIVVTSSVILTATSQKSLESTFNAKAYKLQTVYMYIHIHSKKMLNTCTECLHVNMSKVVLRIIPYSNLWDDKDEILLTLRYKMVCRDTNGDSYVKYCTFTLYLHWQISEIHLHFSSVQKGS